MYTKHQYIKTNKKNSTSVAKAKNKTENKITKEKQKRDSCLTKNCTVYEFNEKLYQK